MERPNPEDYLGLVKKFANFWAHKFPYAAEDILSVAYVALIRQCNNYPGKGSIKGWIKVGVDSLIKEYLSEDRTIRVPFSEVQRRLREHPEDLQLPKCQGGDTVKFFIAEEDEESPKMPNLEDLNLTPLEIRIIKLRIAGKSLKEIAKEVGLKNHTNVSYYLKKIQVKYSKLKGR